MIKQLNQSHSVREECGCSLTQYFLNVMPLSWTMLQLDLSSFMGAYTEEKPHLRHQKRFHEETWHLWFVWLRGILTYENSAQEPMEDEHRELRLHAKPFCKLYPLPCWILGWSLWWWNSGTNRAVGRSGILGVIDQYWWYKWNLKPTALDPDTAGVTRPLKGLLANLASLLAPGSLLGSMQWDWRDKGQLQSQRGRGGQKGTGWGSCALICPRG